jgi:SAM-dependent methyltransferase
MERKAHWEHVYSTKGERGVSWFQEEPTLSLELIRAVSPAKGRVIDVGGGASVLVDRLLDLGFDRPTVLDISGEALARARDRLGKRAERVRWVEADVTTVERLGEFDVWHDRAVFHFLTETRDRRKYVELARQSVPPGGHVVIATFALTGPPKCSGLDVCRYDPASLAAELGAGFSLVKEAAETHHTPRDSTQEFTYAVFRREAT